MDGYEDGTFRPNTYMSLGESVKIVLKMLGYNDETINNNYIELAKSIGLFNNVNNQSTYVTRESISLLIYNALDCNIVSNNSNNKKTLLENLGRKEKTYIDDNFAIDHVYMDLSDYMFSTLNVYYDVNNKIVYIEKPIYSVIEGDVVSASSRGAIFLKDEYGNSKLYNLNGVPIVFNGKRSYIDVGELKNSYVKLIIDKENDNKLIGVVVKKVTDVKIIEFNDLYKQNSFKFAGKYLPMNKNNIFYDKIVIKGDAKSLYDIRENDVVYFYETKEIVTNKSILTIEVVRNQITGILKSYDYRNYNNYYCIGSREYITNTNAIINEIPSVIDTVTAILDKNNTILKLDIIKYAKSPDTYAKVLDVTDNNTTLPTVSIVNQYGEIKTYSLKENSNVVTKTAINGNILYSTNLKKNDFIKYDALNDSTIKIVEPISTINIASNYNSSTGIVGNSYCRINNYTYIIQQNNNTYSKLYYTGLYDYIEGTAVVNSNGIVDFLILEKNVKNESPAPSVNTGNTGNTGGTGNNEVQPPAPNKGFSGTLLGVLNTINTSNKGYVTLFNYNYKLYLQNNILSSINGYKDQLVMLKVDNDYVQNLYSFTPEISNSKVTAVYKGLLEIDNLSYVEYSNDVKVFICTKDSSGKVTSFRNASVSDIKISSIVQLYNTKKSSNGVFDVIVIMK